MGRGRGARTNQAASNVSGVRTKRGVDFFRDMIPAGFDPDYTNEITNEFQQLPVAEMDALNIHLRPRAASDQGFLAKDENLLDVVTKDVSDLEAVGLTPQELGIELFNTIQPFFPRFGGASPQERLKRNGVPDHIEVTGGSFYRGWQSCPFTSSGLCHCDKKENNQIVSYHNSSQLETVLGNLNIRIHNKNINEKIEVSGIIAHLAADHNFFEGNVSHRVDPLKLARILFS